MNKKRAIAITGSVCIVVAMIVAGLVFLLKPDTMGTKSTTVFDHPTQASISAEPEEDLTIVPEDIAASYEEAKGVNDDTKGWLYIPDTPINHPVVQAADNDYYLRRGLDQNYSFEGVLFFDYMDVVTDGLENFTRNTIIYGHNTTTSGIGTEMFASLLNYDDIEYAEAHPYIYLVTDEGQSVWEIFAAFHTDTNFYYIENNPSDQAFRDMIDTAKRRSTNVYEVTPNQDDHILTLSTCAYKYRTASQGDERFVVMARLIENPTSGDIEPITLKPNENLEEPVFN